MDQNLTQEEQEQLIVAFRFLGEARMSTYRNACDGSDFAAMALYEWNLRISAAFQEILMTLEVALRNAIDEQLSVWNQDQSGNFRNQGRLFTRSWIENPATPLHGMMQDAIAEATRQAVAASGRRQKDHPRRKVKPTHDDVLSQISFGKWTSLMPYGTNGRLKATRYTALWEESLAQVFPHAPQGDRGMRDVAARLHRLHHLRNRIAHGENILSAQPEHRLIDAFFIVKYMDPALGDWLMKISRVRAVSKQRPRD